MIVIIIKIKSILLIIGYEDKTAPLTAGEKLIKAHSEFKKFAESVGVKVFNCTRGGMLEVYPRVELKNVLKR